ncbi:MAG: hypothetical protein KatS3mg105_3411 [Gemmatales bacterium]|nr:MAG: hypothetical protein KatS3mg105_3411 [Gemmatales bacterium]
MSERSFSQRAAELAISRYGADAAQVKRALQATLRAQAAGIQGDLLDMLIVQKVLTPSDAEALRRELNGVLITRADTPAGTYDTVSSHSGQYPRQFGEFTLLRRLGAGGMGSVYQAFQESTQKTLAIKVLSQNLVNNPAYVHRFYREARNGAELDHPNIIRCFGAGCDKATGKHFLIMEYVDGPSVQQLLERYGRLPVGDAVRIILDVARALEYIHSRNFIHRDIKPDNILLTQSGIAKLADLGLAKYLDDGSLTTRPHGFGTPWYMPCEQAIDASAADQRSDLYALGATFYHMLTGSVPFPGDTHRKVAEKKLAGKFVPASRLHENIPAVLDPILARLLARAPEQRYPSAANLAQDLRATGLASTKLAVVAPDPADEEEAIAERLTRMDLEAADLQPINADPNLWYLRYPLPNGTWCQSRASGEEIIERLRVGNIPATTEVCRNPRGPFLPALSFPSFRRGVQQKTR